MYGHCACSVRARAVALFDNMGAGTKNRFIIPVKVCSTGCSILSIDFHLDPHALLDIKFSRNSTCTQGVSACNLQGHAPGLEDIPLGHPNPITFLV